MRRERAEVVGDRLLVTDIGKHPIENRQRRFLGRNGNPRLRHQCEQPDRLKHHCFAARIGPTDHQDLPAGIHIQRNRGSLPVFPAKVVFQQGMPRFDQAEKRTARKGRTHAIEVAPKPCFGKNDLNIGRKRARKLDLAQAGLNQIGQFGKDACGFVSFFLL